MNVDGPTLLAHTVLTLDGKVVVLGAVAPRPLVLFFLRHYG